MSDTPLFIPLKREFFEAFVRGEKTCEYRVLGPRWNAQTCKIGRSVTLSLGYGKTRRLHGIVTSFDVLNDPLTIPGWRECYGERDVMAACIGIMINQPREFTSAEMQAESNPQSDTRHE